MDSTSNNLARCSEVSCGTATPFQGVTSDFSVCQVTFLPSEGGPVSGLRQSFYNIDADTTRRLTLLKDLVGQPLASEGVDRVFPFVSLAVATQKQ